MKFTFKKSERLNSKKVIEQLFDKKGRETNQSVFLYPFRVSYVKKVESEELKVESENNVESLSTLNAQCLTQSPQILI